MKRNKTKYIARINKDENYYFIKPFEISSSYSTFINTWKKVNKIYRAIEDVKDASLMQSFSEKSKYGFFSFSNWESKEAFINSNLKHNVLNYHNLLNGDDSKSALYSLYKLISYTNYNGRNKAGNTLEIITFENDGEDDNDIRKFWDSICETKNGSIASSHLFKAVYRKAKFRFLGFLYNTNKSIITSDSNIVRKRNGYNVHSSFYKKVKKY